MIKRHFFKVAVRIDALLLKGLRQDNLLFLITRTTLTVRIDALLLKGLRLSINRYCVGNLKCQNRCPAFKGIFTRGGELTLLDTPPEVFKGEIASVA